MMLSKKLLGTIIMKFGGTSVADTGAFRNVAAIVKATENGRPIVVTSAIAGFTNALLASVDAAVNGDSHEAARALDEWVDRHVAVAYELLSSHTRQAFESTVLEARTEVGRLLKIIGGYPVTRPPLQDEIVAFGELLSSQLLAAVLRENDLLARWMDARECIKTNEDYGSAMPIPETNPTTAEK